MQSSGFIHSGSRVLWLGLILNSSISQWAIRWRVPMEALSELNGIFGLAPANPFGRIEDPHSETYVQSLVRLEAGRKGLKLWRNNVGVLPNPETGQPVRYGLGNDSPALNKAIKSGDLIGWRRLFVTQSLVGCHVAQFVSRECKRPAWSYSGTDREKAQLRWAEAVNSDGGDAAFCIGEGSL